MKDEEKLRDAKVIMWLPHVFGRNEAPPEGLVGATVVQVGTFEESSLVETGGLVIDYHPAGSQATRHIVLAFNDTAMWEVANSQI